MAIFMLLGLEVQYQMAKMKLSPLDVRTAKQLSIVQLGCIASSPEPPPLVKMKKAVLEFLRT